MEVVSKDATHLRIEYEDGKPVMKMSLQDTKLTIHFAEKPLEQDTKKVIVDMLTSQYIRKVSE